VKICRQPWIVLFLLVGVLVILALPSLGLFPVPPALRAARFAAQILMAMIGAATLRLGLPPLAIFRPALHVESDRIPVSDVFRLSYASRC
jgi:hypothetical protein